MNRRLDFVDVLRSFLLLLKRLAQKFWANSDPAYPKIVFDSVKDNPAFLGLLQDLHKSNDNLWTLSWMPELLLTIQGEVAYGEVLAKMVDFLCEELQHERFDEARPIIMNSAIQVRPKPLKSESTDQGFSFSGQSCEDATLRRIGDTRIHSSTPSKFIRGLSSLLHSGGTTIPNRGRTLASPLAAWSVLSCPPMSRGYTQLSQHRAKPFIC